MPINNPNRPNATDVLVASAARTVTGASTGLSGFIAANKLIVELDISAVTGTTPTLDLVIQDTLDGVNWFTIATFATQNAVAHLVQNVTTPFSDQIRASWTIGGTTPSFTFSVSVLSET